LSYEIGSGGEVGAKIAKGSNYVTLAEMIAAQATERAEEAQAKVACGYDIPLRAQLLREAEEITCGNRHMDYGDPVENHERIARIASEATGHQLTAHDVVMVLIAAKMARARISPTKRDHYVDMMAYAGIAYECAMASDDPDA
jgi:hypothetical protein